MQPAPVPPPTPPAPPVVQLDSVNTLINVSWQFFLSHARRLIGITGVVVAIQFIFLITMMSLGVVSENMTGTGVTINPAASVLAIILVAIIGLLIVLISVWSTVALYQYVISNNATLSVGGAYRQAGPKAWSYFGTNLVVGLITLGGLILLIIPGIYWGVLYGFAPLIGVAEGNNATTLARSKFLVSGKWWAVFWRNIVFGLLMVGVAAGVSFVFSVFFGIVSRMYGPLSLLGDFGQYFATLVTAPLSAVFTYHLYRSLRRVRGEV